MTDTVSAETLVARLDALWLEMNDALAEPPATARILNALHEAAQALRTPPAMSADHIGDATNMIAPVTWRDDILERLRALDFAGHYDEARFQYTADAILDLTRPSADTGELRERIVSILYCPDISWGTANAKADAILALIQTERA